MAFPAGCKSEETGPAEPPAGSLREPSPDVDVYAFPPSPVPARPVRMLRFSSKPLAGQLHPVTRPPPGLGMRVRRLAHKSTNGVVEALDPQTGESAKASRRPQLHTIQTALRRCSVLFAYIARSRAKCMLRYSLPIAVCSMLIATAFSKHVICPQRGHFRSTSEGRHDSSSFHLTSRTLLCADPPMLDTRRPRAQEGALRRKRPEPEPLQVPNKRTRVAVKRLNL